MSGKRFQNFLNSSSLFSALSAAAADAPAPAPAPEGPIVKILNTNGQTFQIPIHLPNESVESLKQKISATCSVPPPQQRLIYKGRMLQDGQTLQACGIEDKVVVHLFARPPRAVPQGGDSSSGKILIVFYVYM